MSTSIEERLPNSRRILRYFLSNLKEEALFLTLLGPPITFQVFSTTQQHSFKSRLQLLCRLPEQHSQKGYRALDAISDSRLYAKAFALAGGVEVMN